MVRTAAPTDRASKLRPDQSMGRTLPHFIAVTVAAWLAATGISALADALDVPEQIAPQGSADIGDGSIAPPPDDQIRVDEIGAGDASDPVSVEQSQEGRDLCDPSVSDATRARYGVDCEALDARERANVPGTAPAVGTASDPLLQPRDKDARDNFEDLNLGDDVPATVILQN